MLFNSIHRLTPLYSDLSGREEVLKVLEIFQVDFSIISEFRLFMDYL
jgi:hypothetical protein